MDNKEWHFLDISSGRFLCDEHGGFCDVADNYSTKCLACGTHTSSISSNYPQRTFRLINGLQERSRRNVGLVGSVIGGASALNIVNGMVSRDSLNENIFLMFPSLSIALMFWLASITLFSLSMSHIKVVKKGRLRKLSLEDWEIFLTKSLCRMEAMHW